MACWWKVDRLLTLVLAWLVLIGWWHYNHIVVVVVVVVGAASSASVATAAQYALGFE